MSERRKQLNLIMATPDLKRALQELAMLDFESFLRKAQIDEVQIFICAESAKARSYQAIANSLKRHGVEISRSTVFDRCKKCPDKSDT